MVEPSPDAYRVKYECRLCFGTLNVVLSLGATPLANEFPMVGEEAEQEGFPLFLSQCRLCGHVQLPVVVDPHRLFVDYVYASSTSPVFVEHFRQYAESLSMYIEPNRSLVVEIGSNDGTLLRFLQKKGARVLGVDPALNIAHYAQDLGIPTIQRFFSSGVAKDIVRRHGRADLVIANNVFAHADDLRDIVRGVRELLLSHGRFVFEVQYLGDLLDKGLFDMIYHEHLSYHHLTPLKLFFQREGMELVHVEHVDTHGGSIRCTVSPQRERTCDASVYKMVEAEQERFTAEAFDQLAQRISGSARALLEVLKSEERAGRVVCGYGAPAKLTTLMYQFGMHRDDIAYICDDSPLKRGRVTPGLHIPVVESGKPWPDTFIIFAWNFADSIAAKLRAEGFDGKIIVPLPELREIA